MITRLNECVFFNDNSSLLLIKYHEEVFNFLDTVHFNAVFKQTKHYATYAQSYLIFLPVSAFRGIKYHTVYIWELVILMGHVNSFYVPD